MYDVYYVLKPMYKGNRFIGIRIARHVLPFLLDTRWGHDDIPSYNAEVMQVKSCDKNEIH